MAKKRGLVSGGLVGLLAVLMSCGGDKEPPGPQEESIFQLTVDEAYISAFTDDWVIISNHLGEVVSFTSFETGEVVAIDTFASLFSENMTVTLLSYQSATSQLKEVYTVRSYKSVPLGSSWNLAGNVSPYGRPSEDVKLELTNRPLSARTSTWYSSLGSYVNSISHSSVTTLAVTTPLTDLLISYTGYFRPRHKLLDLSQGSNYSFNVSTEFDYFDEEITVPIVSESLSLGLSGLTSEETSGSGAHNFGGWFGSTDGTFKVGYNNGYDLYRIDWTATTNNNIQGYLRISDTPPKASDFEMSSFDFTVSNNGINSFGFSADSELSYYQGEWRQDNVVYPKVNWKVMSPVDSPKPVISAFPTNVHASWDALDDLLSKLIYAKATFTVGLNGHTYEKRLEWEYVVANKNTTPIEYRTVSN
jgi:hypothetical protein